MKADQGINRMIPENSPHLASTKDLLRPRAPLASTRWNGQMKKYELSPRQTWSAVGSMGLCVSMLIAAEFMPVSLLTPLARDLRATEGMAGQAISISGLFAGGGQLADRHLCWAVQSSACAVGAHRRHVAVGMAAVMLP